VYVISEGVWFHCMAVPRRYGEAWICGRCCGRRRGVVLRVYDDRRSRAKTRCPVCKGLVRVEFLGPVRMRWFERQVVNW
jgi:hypothetical protein